MGNHTLADPGHAPAGRSVLHVATIANGALWVDLDEATYRERKRELEEYFVDRLAEAIPDVRDRIEVCETGTPHTMQRYSWNPLGSIYGYAYTPTSHSIFRPQPRTSIPGLYLAGAWTFPGAGFGGTMLSGYNTAKLVFEDMEGREPAQAWDPSRRSATPNERLESVGAVDDDYADHLGGINRVIDSDVAVGDHIPNPDRFVYVGVNVDL